MEAHLEAPWLNQYQLKRGDVLAVLVEWSGDMSVYVGGTLIGRWPNAMEPRQVFLPLYGVVDLWPKEGEHEHLIRSVQLCSEPVTLGFLHSLDAADKAEEGLLAVYKQMSSSARTAKPAVSRTGPSCDVHACARILLQCFCGGSQLKLSPAMEQFQVALAVWANEKCPITEKRYGLLAALKALQADDDKELADIKPEYAQNVRQILAKGLTRSRQSRISSCGDMAELLNEAMGWLELTPDFLHSHQEAVELAVRRQRAMQQSQAVQAPEAEGGKSQKPKSRSARSQLPSGSVPVLWDLRNFALSGPHITRVVQILTSWSRRSKLQVVALSRFSGTIDDQLQEAFINCFHSNKDQTHGGLGSMPIEGSAPTRSLRKGKSSRSQEVREASDFQLQLEDILLPVESWPRDRFPLSVLVERGILWLVACMVSELDLTPTSSVAGQEPFTIGHVPGTSTILAGALKRNQALRKLNLRSCNIGPAGVCEIAEAVAFCHRLEWLDLSNNSIGPKGAEKVIKAVDQTVTYLDLSRNELGPEGAAAVAEALGQGTTSIKEIRLAQNSIGLEGAEALTESLYSNSTLTFLDVGRNEIPPAGVTSLIRASTVVPNFKEIRLDLNGNWSGADEVLVDELTNLLGAGLERGQSARSSLQALSLRHCGIRGSTAAKLFASLANNQELKRLALSWNGIRQVGCEQLAGALASGLCALEELDLRDNPVGAQDVLPQALREAFNPQRGDQNAARRMQHARAASRTGVVGMSGFHSQGLPALGTAMVFNTSLKVLNLGNTELTMHGTFLLVEALQGFQAMQALHLYHNPGIGDQGAQALARWLMGRSDSSGLKILSLAACSIGDIGGQALLAALRGNQALTELDLSANSLGDKVVSPLAESVLASCVLQKVNLAMNSIGKIGIKNLITSVANPNQDHEKLQEVNIASQVSPSAADEASNFCKTAELHEEILKELQELKIPEKVLAKFPGLRPALTSLAT